eukprot:2844515-Rhodomonas_salina.1
MARLQLLAAALLASLTQCICFSMAPSVSSPLALRSGHAVAASSTRLFAGKRVGGLRMSSMTSEDEDKELILKAAQRQDVDSGAVVQALLRQEKSARECDPEPATMCFKSVERVTNPCTHFPCEVQLLAAGGVDDGLVSAASLLQLVLLFADLPQRPPCAQQLGWERSDACVMQEQKSALCVLRKRKR